MWRTFELHKMWAWNLHIHVKYTENQGCSQGFFGVLPLSTKNFFNLLWFFEKKNSKPKSKFSVRSKKCEPAPQKISGYASAVDRIVFQKRKKWNLLFFEKLSKEVLPQKYCTSDYGVIHLWRLTFREEEGLKFCDTLWEKFGYLWKFCDRGRGRGSKNLVFWWIS